MEKMEYNGSVFRIRKCVFDLLSLEDDLVEDDCDEEGWDLIQREIRLKSTFLYCDFNKVIANRDDEDKEAFTNLANKLFYYLQELDNAVKTRSISITRDCYGNAVLVLQEVVAALIAP